VPRQQADEWLAVGAHGRQKREIVRIQPPQQVEQAHSQLVRAQRVRIHYMQLHPAAQLAAVL